MTRNVQDRSLDLVSVSVGELRTAGILVLGVALLGLVARLELRRLVLDEPRIGWANAFEVQFARFEPPLLVGLACCALLMIASTFRVRAGSTFTAPFPSVSLGRGAVAVISCAVLLVTAIGTRFVFRNYPFAMDEFTADFQAKIFARGILEAPIAPEWRHYVYALQPIFIEYRPATHAWSQTYLPVYAGLRAVLHRASLDTWTNPILGSLAVFLMAAVARRLWPGDRVRLAAAVLLLVGSSQFLLMSTSYAYAMPAHLVLNLLWLLLYLRASERGSWWPVGILGAVGLGLHNPFPHFLFAAPFLLRLLKERKLAALTKVGCWYGAGAVGWWLWLSRINPYAQSGRLAELFALPHDRGLLQMMNLTVLFSWQAPVVVLLFFFAVLQWRRLEPLGRDLALGVAATFVFYAFVPLGQIHGWGYRFTYAVLANVILLGVFALPRMAALPLPALRPVLLLCWLAVLVQVPVRAMQVRGFVEPYARAFSYIRTLGRTAVVVDASRGWFAVDLVRNDPFLQSDPKIFLAERFSAESRDLLRRQTGMPVREMTVRELAAAGVPVPARQAP